MKKLSGILVCNVFLFGAVDINHASISDLLSLNGIGKTKATRIVDYKKYQNRFLLLVV